MGVFIFFKLFFFYEQQFSFFIFIKKSKIFTTSSINDGINIKLFFEQMPSFYFFFENQEENHLSFQKVFETSIKYLFGSTVNGVLN